jgi:hypothetical protein
LFFLGRLAFFGLLEPVLAVIHDPAHRWRGIWCDLYEIHTFRYRHFECLCNRHDPRLFTVLINQPDLRRDDIPVAPRFFFGCDVKFSC